MTPDEVAGTPVRTRLDWTIPVTAALVAVLASMAFRVPCVAHRGNLTYSERHLCYTDVYALYGTEGLNAGRVPYFETRPDGKYVEYPVLTGVWMYATARIGGAIVGGAHRGDVRGYDAFFWVNQAGFALLILGAAAALGMLAGPRRALLFAAAPTLVLHGGVSWDMLAVAPFVFGILAFSRGKDASSGLWLGIGGAAKLFPVFALPFLALQRLREGKRRAAGTVLGTGIATFVLINLPFAVFAAKGWRQFFSLNRDRPADWDSVWYQIINTWHVTFDRCTAAPCTPTRLNAITLLLFVGGAGLLAAWQWRRSVVPGDREVAPGIRTSTGVALFGVVLWFLMVNKVWSPQYGIWILPFWAFAIPLAMPRLVATWIALQVLEIFVFVTRFWMFAQKTTYPWFRAAIFSRLAAFLVLLGILLVTARTRERADGTALS